MTMWAQRTKYVGRFTVNLINGTVTAGMVAGTRGARGILVKAWGGASSVVLAGVSVWPSWDGVSLPGPNSMGENSALSGGNTNGSEAGTGAAAYFWPKDPSGFSFPAYSIQLTAAAASAGVKVDVWLLDADGNCALDTMMP